MTVEERAKAYEVKVAEMVALYLEDGAAFRAAHPAIRVSFEPPNYLAHPLVTNPELGIVDSIARHLLEGTGFDYQIVEYVGQPPQCVITRYNAMP